jgi:hypothetical protein
LTHKVDRRSSQKNLTSLFQMADLLLLTLHLDFVSFAGHSGKDA